MSARDVEDDSAARKLDATSCRFTTRGESTHNSHCVISSNGHTSCWQRQQVAPSGHRGSAESAWPHQGGAGCCGCRCGAKRLWRILRECLFFGDCFRGKPTGKTALQGSPILTCPNGRLFLVGSAFTQTHGSSPRTLFAQDKWSSEKTEWCDAEWAENGHGPYVVGAIGCSTWDS